jgi:hypothetical protein
MSVKLSTKDGKTFLRQAVSEDRHGKTTFTAVFLKTDRRFTFQVRAPMNQRDPNRPISFVSVLTGSSNEDDYSYLGFITGNKYYYGNKSRISREADSSRAWECIWSYISQGKEFPSDRVEIYHEGSCGRCGRKLTVPSSIKSGIGPVCAGK